MKTLCMNVRVTPALHPQPALALPRALHGRSDRDRGGCGPDGQEPSAVAVGCCVLLASDQHEWKLNTKI